MTQDLQEMVIARFTFKPERAHEFSADGNIIVEQMLESVDEVVLFCDEFGDAIEDVSCIVNGKVVSLSDVPDEE